MVADVRLGTINKQKWKKKKLFRKLLKSLCQISGLLNCIKQRTLSEKTILVKNIKMKTIKLDSDASKSLYHWLRLWWIRFSKQNVGVNGGLQSSLEPTEWTLQVNYKKTKPRQKSQLRLKVNKTRLQDSAWIQTDKNKTVLLEYIPK